MSNSENTAFPCTHTSTDGLTKREYFAALAMQGLLANDYATGGPEKFSKEVLEYTDALLEELDR